MNRQPLTDKQLEEYVANMSDASENHDPFSGTDSDSEYVPSDDEVNNIEVTHSENEYENEDHLDVDDDNNFNDSSNNNDDGPHFTQSLYEWTIPGSDFVTRKAAPDERQGVLLLESDRSSSELDIF